MFVSLPVPETSPVPNPRLFPSPLILFLQNLARKYIIWAPSEQFSPGRILVAKSKSGGRCHQNKVFFLLGGEYRPPFVLRKSRTSLRKLTSPPVSGRMESLSLPRLDNQTPRYENAYEELVITTALDAQFLALDVQTSLSFLVGFIKKYPISRVLRG